MDNIQVGFAEPRDAPEIATLLAGGFSEAVGQLLIHGCRGASEHIRMQIERCLPNAESAYFVARAGDRLAGAAELKREPAGLFLNYIGVDPACRGRGVGTKLLSDALCLSGVNSGQISLDVLHDNPGALQWYARLGFATGKSAEFVEIAPKTGGGDGAAYVSGLPQADLCQERFGFSQFRLVTGSGAFSVGRIGDRWFRLTDLAAIDHNGIFAALRVLDPARGIFAVVPASAVTPERVVRPLALTHRMTTDIARLVSLMSRDR